MSRMEEDSTPRTSLTGQETPQRLENNPWPRGGQALLASCHPTCPLAVKIKRAIGPRNEIKKIWGDSKKQSGRKPKTPSPRPQSILLLFSKRHGPVGCQVGHRVWGAAHHQGQALRIARNGLTRFPMRSLGWIDGSGARITKTGDSLEKAFQKPKTAPPPRHGQFGITPEEIGISFLGPTF